MCLVPERESTTDNMVVREVKADELDALLALYEDLNPEDVPAAPDGALRAVWGAACENPMIRYVAAELDARLVASCTLIVVPNLTGQARPFGLIENVVTHREFRRRGLGTAALEYALDLAWDAGCYKVMVLTGRKEPGVHRFYERADFHQDGKTGFIARPPEKAD